MRGQAQIDAVVGDQVLRLLRLRPCLEIRRRSDDRHAHVRSDPHGDHVLGDLLAHPHPGVVALGHDVGQAVVDDDLDLDVRVPPQKLHELGPKDGVGRIFRRGNPNGPGGLFAKLAQGRQLGVDLLKARTEVRSRRSPASVGETLRVVRVRSLRPRRASSARMVWLSADCETPSLAAAFVKLRSRPTARKASRSSRFPRRIYRFCS